MEKKRFITFPTVFPIFILRQVLHNWVPKKLDVAIGLNPDVPLDLNPFKGNCEIKEGEVALPMEAEVEKEVEVDMNMVN